MARDQTWGGSFRRWYRYCSLICRSALVGCTPKCHWQTCHVWCLRCDALVASGLWRCLTLPHEQTITGDAKPQNMHVFTQVYSLWNRCKLSNLCSPDSCGRTSLFVSQYAQQVSRVPRCEKVSHVDRFSWGSKIDSLIDFSSHFDS